MRSKNLQSLVAGATFAALNRAFIACGPDNYVAVLDLNTLQVTGHINVGGEPDGLAWAIRP
jgi:YVTN family beta-propeller protein